MSQPPSQTPPPWRRDASGRWFYYRSDTDTVVYQSGEAYPRPANVPRSLYLTGSGNTPQANVQAPQQSSNYTYGRPSGSNSRPQNTQGDFRTYRDPRSQVQTTVATGPGVTTDDFLRQHGVQASQELIASAGAAEGEAEQLYPSYQVRRRSFFRVGRVFHVLWAEPAGTASRSSISGLEQVERTTDPNLVPSRYLGHSISSKTRRFVVIREGTNYCSALPITTYGGQGVAKPGVTKSEHAIIYTGHTAPAPQPSEVPPRGSNQGPMRDSIRVVPDATTEALDPMSRLDFGKVCTIHHNYKAKAFGMVHEGSLRTLKAQFNYIWRLPEPSASVSTGESSSSAAVRAMQAPQSNQIGSALPATPAEMTQHATNAQAAYSRLLAQGFSRHDAMQQLVTVLQRTEHCSTETAHATVYARLTYRLPPTS